MDFVQFQEVITCMVCSGMVKSSVRTGQKIFCEGMWLILEKQVEDRLFSMLKIQDQTELLKLFKQGERLLLDQCFRKRSSVSSLKRDRQGDPKEHPSHESWTMGIGSNFERRF